MMHDIMIIISCNGLGPWKDERQTCLLFSHPPERLGMMIMLSATATSKKWPVTTMSIAI
jgi:hypothetical protein